MYDQVNAAADAVVDDDRVYQEARCDMVVALGGGSRMMRPRPSPRGSQPSQVARFIGLDHAPQRPVIAIPPHHAGAGGEVARFAVVTDTAAT